MLANAKRSFLLFIVALMVLPLLGVTAVAIFQAITSRQLPANYQAQKRDEALQQAQQATTSINPTRLTAAEIQQARKALPNQTLLLDQAYRVNLPKFGACLFVPTVEKRNGQSQLALYLVRNGKLAFELPSVQNPVNPQDFQALREVAFTELNFDGQGGDVIVIADYRDRTATNPKATIPVTRFYFASGKGYAIVNNLDATLTQRRVKTTTEAARILREEYGLLPP